MAIGRRDVMLGALGLGITLVAGPRLLAAGETEVPPRFSTYGLAPGGAIDHIAMLQAALDATARSGTPLFLPPGVYSTSRLELKSGTHFLGVPGKSILRYRGGGTILSIDHARDIRIEGLALDGGGHALGQDGSLLGAMEVERLEVSNCRFIGSSGDGLLLRRVSGRVTDCDIGDIRKAAIFSENARRLAISRNSIHDCGDKGILVWGSEPGETIVAKNIVERAATGITVTKFYRGGQRAVVRGNFVRNLFFRKCIQSSGNGISVEADAVVSGNVVENAPGFGILVGWIGHLRELTVTNNLIRNAHIGIGVSADRAASAPLITGNLITGTKDGAIRVMNGPTPIGPDLARSSEAFRNLVS